MIAPRTVEDRLRAEYFDLVPDMQRTLVALDSEVRHRLVSSLIGSFWDVEHSAVYKTSPNMQGLMGSSRMNERQRTVLAALRDFEDEFERLVSEAAEFEA